MKLWLWWKLLIIFFPFSKIQNIHATTTCILTWRKEKYLHAIMLIWNTKLWCVFKIDDQNISQWQVFLWEQYRYRFFLPYTSWRSIDWLHVIQRLLRTLLKANNPNQRTLMKNRNPILNIKSHILQTIVCDLHKVLQISFAPLKKFFKVSLIFSKVLLIIQKPFCLFEHTNYLQELG